MKLSAYVFLFFAVICYSYSQHKNITIITSEANPNEPSICIDPKNPNVIVAGTNIHWYAVSTDAGLTWDRGKLTSGLGVWGDPVIIVDTNSNFYFFHLANNPNNLWLDRIICQKTTDLGLTWNDSSYTEPDGKQHDKEWAVVDRNNNHIYMTWTVFDIYGSPNPNDSSHILFSKSTDGGITWSKPLRINDRGGDCIDSDATVEGAVPVVDSAGVLYVVWSGHDKLYFDKSTDGGETWLDSDMIIADQYGGWNYDIPGLTRCNGLPAIACDLSQNQYKNTIYVNYTDQKHGINDTDVWLIKSTDGGETWSSPSRVNNDTEGKHQFFTWMTIDQSNGYLYFVFYDRRNHPDIYTDVYMAVSKDGGETIENFKISETPFAPNENIFFGDYNNISAVNGTIRPIWTRMEETKRSILTAIINPDSIAVSVEQELPIFTDFDAELYQNYPNPFSSRTYISFKLNKEEIIDLAIYDSRGNVSSKLINSIMFPPGKHTLTIDAEELNLKSGVYYYVLRTINGTVSRRMITIK